MRNRLSSLLLATLALPVTACAGRNAIGSRLGSHPSELVGEWVDSSKTTASDSSIWVLGASGEDKVRKVNAAGGSSERHYGYWFLQGSLASADRSLCFTNRPGRSAPSCQTFGLDTVQTAAGARKRLTVHGYRGAHSIRDRVLLEHQ